MSVSLRKYPVIFSPKKQNDLGIKTFKNQGSLKRERIKFSQLIVYFLKIIQVQSEFWETVLIRQNTNKIGNKQYQTVILE